MTNLLEKLKNFLTGRLKLPSRFWNWVDGFRLQPGWERGAIAAVGILIALYAGFAGVDAQSGYGLAVDILVPVFLAEVVYFLLLWIGTAVLRLLLRLPPLSWVIVIAGLIAGGQVWGSRTSLHGVLNLILVLSAVLLGVGIYSLVRIEWRKALIQQKFLIIFFLALGTASVLTIGQLIISAGSNAEPLAVEVVLGAPRIDAPDPSSLGSYSVSTLTYGSGEDLHRPEFSDQADLLTEVVDASAYVSYKDDTPQGFPNFMMDWEPVNFFFTRFSEKARELYWGFGVRELPINGRVWIPEGEGPFPLVLIVHGNHNMTDFSDTGYAYLGELLASRGFIFVSVDENFLNGGLWGTSSGENDARAWLLLKHLEVWREWSHDAGSPFYHKVDMSQIALIGHSRGGEAAALAASFNHLPRYPNDARKSWEFNFNIRSVIAIAPVDEQWRPADHPNPLKDVNYLVLQGSHDGDVYYFDGIQQYDRINFSGDDPDVFKAAVYIYRANHSQFNTSWGNTDKSGIIGYFLNRRALLPEAEQRQIAKVYISAFLEATLKDKTVYRDIFEDYRNAGNWLPQTGYICQYEDPGMRFVADFEEDIDVTTTSIAGGEIVSLSLNRWRELAPRFRNQERQDNHVVRLGWSSTSAYYALDLPAGFNWGIEQDSLFVFKVADARQPEGVEQGLDFSIVLVDEDNQRAEVHLSDVLPLHTQFPALINKMPVWNEEYYKDSSEEVFQTYRIPLKVFLEDYPSLDLSNLRQIRFEFDRVPSGTIYLDDIGFDLLH